MDETFVFETRREPAGRPLIPLSEQRHWIATGETIGSGLRAFVHGLKIIVGMLFGNGRSHAIASALAPSSISPRAAGDPGRRRRTATVHRATKGTPI